MEVPKRAKNLTGQRFTRLTAVACAGRGKHGYLWECMCDCGNTVVATVNHLTQGSTKSCGCLNTEVRAQQCRARSTTHGMAARGRVHPLYSTWANIIQRTTNPDRRDYQFYGGRGVQVCDRWRKSFEAFVSDMGDRPEGLTLDRIDVNGDYTPENCRWASWDVQHQNTRSTRKFDVNGEILSCRDMEARCGVAARTIYQRITKLGLSPVEAMAPGALPNCLKGRK